MLRNSSDMSKVLEAINRTCVKKKSHYGIDLAQGWGILPNAHDAPIRADEFGYTPLSRKVHRRWCWR